MKRLMLIFAVLHMFAFYVCAENNNGLQFQAQNSAHTEPQYQVPITGGINGDNLNLDYKGSDYANVSVKDKNGSVVYQNSINGKNTINLSGYTQGDYTVKVEDSKGNAAVANFQVKK